MSKSPMLLQFIWARKSQTIYGLDKKKRKKVKEDPNIISSFQVAALLEWLIPFWKKKNMYYNLMIDGMSSQEFEDGLETPFPNDVG